MADDGRIAPYAVNPAGFAAETPQDFYQLLRRLECEQRQAPRVGRALRLAQELLRMGQEAALGFAAGPVAAALRHPTDSVLRVQVHCFGMLGPNGPLPLHWTEYVRQRAKHHGDTSLARFLDLFHHRMLSLFYRAWADAQPAVQHDRPEDDRFSTFVASLAGFGIPALRDRDALPDACKLFYAGRFACQVRHPEGLMAIITGQLGLPSSIEEYVGEWVDMSERDRWRLGADMAGDEGLGLGQLGRGTHLGARVWLRQSRFRVVLGPLTREQFERVAPGGPDVAALVALVRGYAGDELNWDLLLRLRHDAVPAFQLGVATLGQATWLHTAAAAVSDDLIYQPLS